MSEHQPDPELDAAVASPMDRRAFVRVASDLVSRCRPSGRTHDVSWPGQVRDISRGGVGLVMRHRFRPGTRLELELRNAAGHFVATLAVRVVHATALIVDDRHGWLLGCAFDKPLEEAEFEALAR
jgi:hypothetical protein